MAWLLNACAYELWEQLVTSNLEDIFWHFKSRFTFGAVFLCLFFIILCIIKKIKILGSVTEFNLTLYSILLLLVLLLWFLFLYYYFSSLYVFGCIGDRTLETNKYVTFDAVSKCLLKLLFPETPNHKTILIEMLLENAPGVRMPNKQSMDLTVVLCTFYGN